MQNTFKINYLVNIHGLFPINYYNLQYHVLIEWILLPEEKTNQVLKM